MPSISRWKALGSVKRVASDKLKSGRTSRDKVINKVAWSLHPQQNDGKRRWKVKEELTTYLVNIGSQTDKRFETGSSVTEKSNDASSHFFDKVQKPKPKNQQGIGTTAGVFSALPVKNIEEIEKCVEILSNGKKRANIFDNAKVSDIEDPGPGYKTAVDWVDEWNAQNAHITQIKAPRNHYLEMLEWSNQGRLPSFPINNEENSEEKDVPFHKHIFLDELLNEGFPKEGPVKKFMDAVTLGLSKNPYLTLKEKEEHINWFREYFNEKRETLETLGVIPVDSIESEV